VGGGAKERNWIGLWRCGRIREDGVGWVGTEGGLVVHWGLSDMIMDE